MTDEKFAEITRNMIQHENILINQRLNWMWTLQGLLAATVGIFWNIDPLPVYLICGFGILSSGLILISLGAADRAIKALVESWKDRIAVKAEYDGPSVIGLDEPNSVFAKFLPWLWLPSLIIVLWVALIVARVLTPAASS